MFIEFYTLNVQYDSLRLSYINNSVYTRELVNYDKIAQFSKKSISAKIENIQIHDNAQNRTKRGLINILGSIVKGITGNLDANDGERIYNILDHLQTNEKSLQSQLKMEYSFSSQLVQNFNDTIQDVKHNQIMLKSKIMQLSKIVKGGSTHQDILFAGNVYNQLLILYNSILNTLQDIENSITFCRLSTLHPSIIKSKELFSELEKIVFHYKSQLPFELKYENILDFEAIIKVNCKIDSNKITYFLSIPIDFDKEFDLYYLLPIPTKHESEFVTIISSAKYLLKSKLDNVITPLNDKCTQGKTYHCPYQLQANYNASCEEGILLHENSSKCLFSKIEILENHIETVPEINQYLSVFPKEEKLQIQCQQEIEAKLLTGIYLIKENPQCKLFFRGRELLFQGSSYGRPIIMDTPHFKLERNDLPQFKINLKTLNLKGLPVNPIVPINSNYLPVYHIPSGWTILLYIMLLTIAIYIWVRKLKINKSKDNPRSQEAVIEVQSKVKLPEEASF